MALESVFAIAPPLVGQQNKDTKNGDMKSSQNEAFKEDFEDDENGDLEEGEILDSGGEDDDSKAGISLNQETSGLLKRSLIGVGSPSELKKTDHANNIKEILVLAGNVDALQAVIAGPQSAKRKNLDLDPEDKNGFDESQKLGSKKKVPRYVDHDFAMDEEGWSPPSISFKGAKVKDTRFDYSRELAAYRGSPYSSSDSNPPYDEPHNSDSPNHRSKSPNMEENGETKIRKPKTSKNASKSRKSNGKIGKKRKLLESKGIRRKKEHKIKTVCKFFMEGKCSKGIDCPFLHTGSPEKKKELCKFYLNGFCAKGNVCLFMHDDFPCKFFHTGAKCYANDKCRFSHKPLSNETKKLLDRYLQSSHVDEESDYHERSRRDHKEPKGKRPCLLGSPPRHIKEAAETKRWQEEMMKLQQKGKGRSAFEIQVSPPRNQVSQIREIKSPMKFSKPNFYTDTLQGSPNSKKCSVVNRSPECRMSTLTPNSSSECPQQVFSKGNCDNHDWKNICELVDKLSPPKNEETSPVVSCNEQEISKQNINEEIAEMVEDKENPMEFDEILSPRTTNEGLTLNTEVNDGFSDSDKRSPVKDKDVPLTATSPPPVSLAEPAPPPINIPSHLPRKQRELYLRIQQHQKEVASRDLKNNNSEASENGDKTATDSEKVINETELTDAREKWYSSEEDDDNDDTDQPLANMLKKLHTMPPTKLGTSSNSSVDVWQMIVSNANRQKDNQKTQSIVASEPEEFWQNILSSAASPSTVKASFSTSNTNQSFLPLGNILATEIQSSSNLVSVGDPNISSSEQKPSYPRDPRLLNRDLRKVSSVSKELSALPPNVPEEKASPLFLSIESGTGSISNRLKDINSMLQNQTPAVVVEGLAGMGNIPYKLHEIVASSPNYLSYIAASQSDPKLLSDPRLRKHIAQGSINQQAQPLYQQCKSNALSNLPSHNIHIGLSHSIPEKAASVCTKVVSSTEDQSVPEPKQILDRVVDPRIRRTDSLGDPRRVNANNSNHAPSENVWTPPAPSIPSPASHLPRAYADPRLAKLHQLQRQLDPRRVKPVSERFGTEQRPSVIQEKQKLNSLNLPTRKLNNISTVAKNIRSQADSQNQSSQSSDLVPLANSLGQKGKDSENVTKIVDKSLSRKSSMTYTSPLNSYEDSLVDSKSSYNSYNRRPNKRLPNSTPCSEPSILNLSSMPSKEIIESIKSSPDFTMCIPSVTESQCVDSNASLKDMFKTIDPTASPFC